MTKRYEAEQILVALEKAESEEEGYLVLEDVTWDVLHQVCIQIGLVWRKSESMKGLRRLIVNVVVVSRITSQIFKNLDLS